LGQSLGSSIESKFRKFAFIRRGKAATEENIRRETSALQTFCSGSNHHASYIHLHGLVFSLEALFTHINFLLLVQQEFGNDSSLFKAADPFDEMDLEEIGVGVRDLNIMAIAQVGFFSTV